MKSFTFRYNLNRKSHALNFARTAAKGLKRSCSGSAARPGKFDDVSDLSRPAECSGHRKVEAGEKTNGRRYGTSATTAESVLPEVPEPRGLPVVGGLLSVILSGGARKLHEHVERRHRELGPVYKERIGPVQAVFVNSPHEYRRIFRLEGPTPRHFLPEAWVLYNELRGWQRGLLFMDGEEWLHFRRILNRIMLVPDPTNLMCGPCQEAAEGLMQKWRNRVRDGDSVPDLESELYQWSIEAMLATLMGSSWHRHKGQLSRDAERLAGMLHKMFVYSAQLSMLPAKLARSLRLSSWTNFVATVDTTMEIVHRMIPEMVKLDGDGLLRKIMDEGIGNNDAVRIVADFILAAGDTTASSMQWALLLLSRYPEWQERLLESVKDLSPREALRDPLLRGIIKDTLRLYPIAPFITRHLPEDSVIGGYVIPKGQLLLLSVYSSGRDEANFPRPNEFLPERWIRTEEGSYRGVTNPHASLPFALGARSCIGRKLAEIQMSLALTELVKAFKLECPNESRINMILHLISVPSESVELRLIQR